MSKSLKIGVVGLGNVGWNLVHRLDSKGYDVQQIVAKKNDHRKKLAKTLDADLIKSVSELDKKLDLIFLCIPDDQLQETASSIDSKSALIHCSGSTSLLDKELSGVFYPFQTFTKFFAAEWKGVPIFIEGNDKSLRDMLLKIANNLSGNANEVSFEQRQAIHMSGVFGANFVNHILFLAKSILDEKNIDFAVLEPLLEETVRKAFEHSPAGSQTGPARRGDNQMISKHLELLKNAGNLSEYYKMFSDDISSTYKKS
jgi:predicted short-subunit dehydrogenase-like oxidoreductase (DUF2520 family)